MRNRIAHILVEMGISPNKRGFHYICDAVEALSMETMSAVHLYDMVAGMNNVSTDAVINGVRREILNAKKNNHELFDKYFKATKPMDALSTIVFVVREEGL